MRFFDHKASKVNSIFHKEMVQKIIKLFFNSIFDRKKVDEDKIRTRQRRGSVFEEARTASKCEKSKILGWKEGSKLLWLACKHGKIEEVKEFIEKGAVVNWSPSKRDIGGQSIFGGRVVNLLS
jgi:hypothetical protein